MLSDSASESDTPRQIAVHLSPYFSTFYEDAAAHDGCAISEDKKAEFSMPKIQNFLFL